MCRKLVCERCAADWASCEEPSGRILRLGFSARLRDVDPTGTLGLVSHWRRGPRLFDLRRVRWIDASFPRRWDSWHACPPRLVAGGRMLYRDQYMSLEGAGYALFESAPTDPTPVQLSRFYISHGSGTCGDCYWVVTDTQRVALARQVGAVEMPAQATAVSFESVRVPPGWQVREYEPLPRKVVQAAHVDSERDLLAASSWGEIVLHRIAGGELQRVGYAKTERSGDVTWIAVAGPWLAAAIGEHGSATRIEVRRLGSDLTIREVVHRHAGAIHAASLSRDGRYLAIGMDRGLVVHALDSGTLDTFDDHPGRIDLVRFGGDDHLLVSADTANRVILRPRHAAGYAQPLIAVGVPDEPIALGG